MLTGAVAQQRRRQGQHQTMGRGRGRGARGQVQGRGQQRSTVQTTLPQAQRTMEATKSTNNSGAPTLSQITMVQARNLSSLRELVQDLAKGVIDLSKVVGTHTTELEDFKSRIENIETELGAEIDYNEYNNIDVSNHNEPDEQQIEGDEIADNDVEPDTSSNVEESS